MRKLCLFFLSLSTWAITDAELLKGKALEDSDKGPPSPVVSSLLPQETLGGDFQSFSFAENRKSFISFQGHVAANSKKFDHLQGDFLYGYKFSSFWAEAVLSMAQSQFKNIAVNQEANGDNPNAEGNFKRKADQKESLVIAGIGISHRFLLPFKVFKEHQVFYRASAYLTYNILEEGLINQAFQGPGMKTTVSAYRQISKSWAIGMAFGHNMASVVRKAQFPSEPTNHRRFNLTWYTLGIDTRLYF